VERRREANRARSRATRAAALNNVPPRATGGRRMIHRRSGAGPGAASRTSGTSQPAERRRILRRRGRGLAALALAVRGDMLRATTANALGRIGALRRDMVFLAAVVAPAVELGRDPAGGTTRRRPSRRARPPPVATSAGRGRGLSPRLPAPRIAATLGEPGTRAIATTLRGKRPRRGGVAGAGAGVPAR
jgi:hypothetical protein